MEQSTPPTRLVPSFYLDYFVSFGQFGHKNCLNIKINAYRLNNRETIISAFLVESTLRVFYVLSEPLIGKETGALNEVF